MKKVILLAALSAAIFAGCSKTELINDPDAGVTNNPNAIGFIGTTTRAATHDITDVEEGFQIYGHQADAADDVWYTQLDGSHQYYRPGTPQGTLTEYNGWYWKLGTSAVEAPKWPVLSAANAMTFIGIYPPEASAVTNLTDLDALSVKVDTDRFSQVDELAAYAYTESVPVGGKMSLDFNHILSKVNVSVTTETGLVVDVQGITFKGINSVGNFDYNSPYATGAWASQGTPESFEYRKANFGGTATAIENNKLTINTTTTTDASQASATVAGDLMLIPQTTAEITYVEDGATANVGAFEAGAHIEVLYRVSTATFDVVGRDDITDISAANPYLNASGALLYDEWSEVQTAWNNGTSVVYPTADADNYDGEPVADDKLYIRAYYPLSEVEWVKGNSYRYNLLIGTSIGSGGYYADSQYYDEAGNPTGLYHGGKPGFPVFSNRIHFIVDVNGWGAEPTTPTPL